MRGEWCKKRSILGSNIQGSPLWGFSQQHSAVERWEIVKEMQKLSKPKWSRLCHLYQNKWFKPGGREGRVLTCSCLIVTITKDSARQTCRGHCNHIQKVLLQGCPLSNGLFNLGLTSLLLLIIPSKDDCFKISDVILLISVFKNFLLHLSP